MSLAAGRLPLTLVAAAALLAACGGASSSRPQPVAADTGTPPPRGAGVRLVYGLEGAPSAGAAELALKVVRERLDGAGLASPAVSVRIDGEAIAVDISAAAAGELSRIRELLEGRPRLELQLVEHDSAFMRALYAHVYEDDRAAALGIGVDIDLWTHDSDGLRFRDYYLVAAEREVLERYLAELAAADPRFAVDDEHEIGYEQRGAGGQPSWRTYYLSSRVELDGSAVDRAQVVTSPYTGAPEVLVELDAEGTARFAALTEASIGKKLAILFGDRVHMAPVVMARIDGGSLSIAMGPADPETAQGDARQMVDALRAGAAPPLRLLAQEGAPAAPSPASSK